jgi:hypothetical protein
VLKSKRVLIVSEMGAGKTYECRAQRDRLVGIGEAAFVLELATLAGSSVREMLGFEEEKRFDEWLRSQSDVATFFLDSIDELRLSARSFEQALKRLAKALSGQLARARIVITTRPIPIDRELIVRHLPVPLPPLPAPTEQAFAKLMMDDQFGGIDEGKDETQDWRYVGLMPLTRDQMRQFADLQGVRDPDALLADIQRRDAEEFAARPQDLLELCADWEANCRIGTHREQVEANIATKLQPRKYPPEAIEISHERAVEGASRLALAAILARKLTLRYDADKDSVGASEPALDPAKALPDWSAGELSTLLQRALFGYASYGRVRFHHRSVLEFLAARRLAQLLNSGVSIRSIKRMLFVETSQGQSTVRPSMRPIAAWLSSFDTIFDEVIARDPAVVLDHGDPQSLRPGQRVRALKAYVERYGRGGRCGLKTPSIQVRRFASAELTQPVKELWAGGVENSEVREFLLQTIAAGHLAGCADLALDAATDGEKSLRERSLAIEALLALDDPRLDQLAATVASDPERWPDRVARAVMVELFPRFMPVQRLAKVLQRVREKSRGIGELNYYLPRVIANVEMSAEYLDQLRVVLSELTAEGLQWSRNGHPNCRTRRPDLLPSLVAACARQAREGVRTESWIDSAMLAIRLVKEDHRTKDGLPVLYETLADLPSAAREAAFWRDDELMQRLHPAKDPYGRIYDRAHYGGIRLDDDRDEAWVRCSLGDPLTPLERREMLLWAEMVLLGRGAESHNERLQSLKSVVADAPSLVAIIDDRLRPQKINADLRRMQAFHEKYAEQEKRRTAKNYTSWVMFWRELVHSPEAAFATDRANVTAWNLWRAMDRSGEASRSSGWSRRLIEAHFGTEIADRLRLTLIASWRAAERPSLPSERAPEDRNRFYDTWQFGMASIAAEAEDRSWAQHLKGEEAELACRYASVEPSGFPAWLDDLVDAHPPVVDNVLGRELSLLQPGQMRTLPYASVKVASFLVPRIREWFVQADKKPGSNTHSERDLSAAMQILMRLGTDADRALIEKAAGQSLAKGVQESDGPLWLATLFALNPAAGVESLETGLEGAPIGEMGQGVKLLGYLFNRHGGNASIDLTGPGFSPDLLLRLLRLAYRHVARDDDIEHEGAYAPGARDDAQQGRNAILSALLASTGTDGWRAKLELAADPMFDHLKDRIIAVAEERAAEDADNAIISEGQFVQLDRTGEAPPTTTIAMFELMRDRLNDIDDLLLREYSQRELWALIPNERLMRRALADVLSNAGNGCYVVDQESVTADEKETDIRLRSTVPGQQAIIELKLADCRSASDLLATLNDQLLTQYMAAEDCRSGCLLVTIARERRWDHPETGQRIDLNELMSLLAAEAERLQKRMGGSVKLMVKGLDLRPRLSPNRVSSS